MASTYLDLPPEMGGTQFGPFQGTVQIGSDGDRCQIVLNPQMGVADVHVLVHDRNGGRYTVSPAQKGYGLFLVRAGSEKLEPVSGGVDASAGDAIVLGNPNGPRFRIRREEKAAAGSASRPGAGRGGRGLASGVMGEMMRVQRAKLMMNNPLYRAYRQATFRWRSGALTNPRVLVALIGSVVGLIAAGTLSCGGILYAVRSNIGF